MNLLRKISIRASITWDRWVPQKADTCSSLGFFGIFGGLHPLTPVGIRPNCQQIFHWDLDDLWCSRIFRGVYPVGWAVESEIVIQRYNLDFFDKLARRADSYRVTVGPLGGAASGALGSRRWGRTRTVTALVCLLYYHPHGVRRTGFVCLFSGRKIFRRPMIWRWVMVE